MLAVAGVAAASFLLSACTQPSPKVAASRSARPPASASGSGQPSITVVTNAPRDPYAVLGVTPEETRGIGVVLAKVPHTVTIAVSRAEAKKILLSDLPSGPGAPPWSPGSLLEYRSLLPGSAYGRFVLCWAFVIPSPIQNTFKIVSGRSPSWTVVFIGAKDGGLYGGFVG